MPSNRHCVMWLRKVVQSTVPGSYLIEKYDQYRREKSEIDRKKVTERELKQLNHKIEKLLTRFGDEDGKTDENPTEDECVICLSANATMQTYPCGHKVTCRKCFVRTIQAAISQRALPLKCVVCRTRIIKVSEAEIVKGNKNPVSHNASGHLFTQRLFSTGHTSLDLGPSSHGLLGCTSAPNGLINPLLMQQQQPAAGWLKDMTTPHKSKTTGFPVRQCSVRRSSKHTTWKPPFVKQLSV